MTVLIWQLGTNPHDHRQMIHDFGDFLEVYERQPNEAVNLLTAKYAGVPVTEAEAASALKHSTVGRATILRDHQLFQRHLLDMPCCRCVQTAYRRNGEVSLIVFEHNEQQLDWFGQRPSIQADCHGKPCCLIQLGQGLAASWPLNEGHVTVVGLRDVFELDALVHELQGD